MNGQIGTEGNRLEIGFEDNRFSLRKYPKPIYPSYKLDLDFRDYFRRENLFKEMP